MFKIKKATIDKASFSESQLRVIEYTRLLNESLVNKGELDKKEARKDYLKTIEGFRKSNELDKKVEETIRKSKETMAKGKNWLQIFKAEAMANFYRACPIGEA